MLHITAYIIDQIAGLFRLTILDRDCQTMPREILDTLVHQKVTTVISL